MSGKQFSIWTHTATDSDGTVTKTRVGVEWYGSQTGEPVFVRTVDEQDGTETLHRGTMRVQRILKATGERLSEPIVGVEISSLGGDVVGKGRSIKQAAEDYASKVLGYVLREKRAQTNVDDAAATAHAYAAALSELSIVESPFDAELVAIIATLKTRLEAAIARRDGLRKAAAS